MLKRQTIENIWQCDSCGYEEGIEINPFYRIVIQAGTPSNSPSIQADFCTSCMKLVPSQLIADYIVDNS